MSNLRWSLLIIGGLLLLGIYLYGRWRGQTRPSEIFDDVGHADSDILMGRRGDSSMREKLGNLKEAQKTELFADLGAAPGKDVKIDLRPSDMKGSLKPLSDQPAVKTKILKKSNIESGVLTASAAKVKAPDKPTVTHVTGKPQAKTAPAGAAPKEKVVSESNEKSDVKSEALTPTSASKSELVKKVQPGGHAKKANLVADEHVVVMHIVAPKNKPFKGKAVLKVFHANGLRYGDMNIFHRIKKREGEVFNVFSLASMVKPGTLNPKDIVESRLQGLSLFTRLPNKAGSIVAFDEMLHCAQHIATTLGGELRDQKLRPMTHGSIMIQRGGLRKRFPEKK